MSESFLNKKAIADLNLSPVNKMLLEEVLSSLTEEELASEGVQIKRQTWSTKSLLDKRIAKVCMILGKQNNDPIYHKYVKFFKLSRVWRARLRQKYSAKARGIILQSGNLYQGSLSEAIKNSKKQ